MFAEWFTSRRENYDHNIKILDKLLIDLVTSDKSSRVHSYLIPGNRVQFTCEGVITPDLFRDQALPLPLSGSAEDISGSLSSCYGSTALKQTMFAIVGPRCHNHRYLRTKAIAKPMTCYFAIPIRKESPLVQMTRAMRDSEPYQPPSGVVMEQNDHVELYSCRFCLDEGTRRNFIAPCNCSGTSKWVHRSCLDQWRSTREDKAFSQCTECHAYYDMVCITNDTWHDSCCRRTRFCAYLSRDLFVLLLISQLVVILCGGFIFLVDLNGHSLLHLSTMQNAYLFYYFAGWFVTLALIGIVSLCFYNQCCESCSNSRSDISCPYYCIDPTPGCVYCGPCESCTSCECAQCSAITCGEEMLAIALVVALILAIIGVFVAVVFGFIILQHIIRRHMSVLNKWNLTREYVVKDLAPGSLSMEDLIQERLDGHIQHDSTDDNDFQPSNHPPGRSQNFVAQLVHYLSGGSQYDLPLRPSHANSSNDQSSYNYHALVSTQNANIEPSNGHHLLSPSAPLEVNETLTFSEISRRISQDNDVEMVSTVTFNPIRSNHSENNETLGVVCSVMERNINAHDEEQAVSPPSAPPLPHLSLAQRSFLERNHLL